MSSWDDVGTWSALRRARELDDTGNGVSAPSSWTPAATVARRGSAGGLYGVDGLLVVTLAGLTFVTTIERAADLKPLLDALPADLRRPASSAGA